MSYKNIFSRYFSTPKQIAVFSLLAGLFGALLVGGLSSLALHSKRESAYNLLARDISGYLDTFFKDLHNTADGIQPLSMDECDRVSGELTSRAAFNSSVRAFLLIHSGVAYCSSATGDMKLSMSELEPELDISKPIDVAIMNGTPMMPGKPVIAVWFQNPLSADHGVFTTLNVNLTPYLVFTSRQQDISSMALVVGNKALASYSPDVVNTDELPPSPTRIANLKGYPIKLYIYGTPWPVEDIQLAILAGLLSGLLCAALCGYFLSVKVRAGKEILTGIKRGQFFVVYQPVVDSQELQMRGIEVLMRWEHPTAGMIPPDAFIGFAEAQQLIVPLTRHLFELIARDAAELQKVLPAGAKLGVNLAPSHLHSPTFKQDIQAFSASLPPNYFQLVFEITERDMLQEKEAMSIFAWLHQQGYEIAVDDFGTGHSALIYLERFTLDYLKIDRGFVNSIGMETVTAPVLDAVLTLAQRLNMNTVAEGVETPEQAKWLIERGCNFLQGYYFSRPLTLSQLLSWNPSHSLYDELKD